MTNYTKPSLRAGFTMVEVVVMLAIITSISAVVLFSFTGLNQSAALNRSLRELALSIRKTQNMSLAVTRIDTQSGPVVPAAVGIRLATTDPDRYFVFADIVRDNKYTSGDAKVGSDSIFPRGTRLNSLADQQGNQHSLVHVIFAAPEATMTISDSNGTALTGDRIDVELITPSQQKKKVVVRISGQVNIK